mmetsp:Transcript_41717/g.50588  ORF Transcript_41717/g.50588 Transcript_41717/m.50588 type:complete len:84 (-) Transcript_41717:177-428(-)
MVRGRVPLGTAGSERPIALVPEVYAIGEEVVWMLCSASFGFLCEGRLVSVVHVFAGHDRLLPLGGLESLEVLGQGPDHTKDIT